MADSSERSSIAPWIMLGAGAVAGVTAAILLIRQCGPDAKARRLITRSERLVDKLEAALAEFDRLAPGQD